MVVVTDCVGTPIRQGDIIVYPGRHGSSMWMNVAAVAEITEERNWRNQPQTVLIVDRFGDRWNDYARKRVKITAAVERCVVTPLTEDEALRRFGPPEVAQASVAQ